MAGDGLETTSTIVVTLKDGPAGHPGPVKTRPDQAGNPPLRASRDYVSVVFRLGYRSKSFDDWPYQARHVDRTMIISSDRLRAPASRDGWDKGEAKKGRFCDSVGAAA